MGNSDHWSDDVTVRDIPATRWSAIGWLVLVLVVAAVAGWEWKMRSLGLRAGDLDDSKMLPILALQPTIADVEQASVWLGGDPDIFGTGEPLKSTASQIVTILTADEEEESPRAP